MLCYCKIFFLSSAFFYLTLANTSYAETPSEIAQLWKERGYVAIARLESLQGKTDPKSGYEYLLEYAFATHALAEKSQNWAFVHKLDSGLDFYKIILKHETELFSINYVYDHETGNYAGIKIELLPKGWNLLSHPKMPNLIMLDVNDGGIVVAFDVNNPMNTFVTFLSDQ